jgi:hypothetical protein
MRRIGIVLLSVLAMVSFTASVTFAANVHFNKSKPPTFTADKSALTLTAAGTIYGLGEGDVVVGLDATGTANTLCTNPGGSSKVPGQNPNFTASGSAAVPAGSIINGHTSFSVTTNPPASPVPGAPECPNSSWTETITGVTWTSARIRVWQPCTDTVTPTNCDPPVLDQTFTGSPFPLDP